MAEILHIDEFEGKCGFAYRHEPYCNGGHNCRHPESANEQVAGKDVGYCYAFSCPLAPEADEESFKKHGMNLEEFEEDMYVEVFDGWQEKKDEGLKALWEEFGAIPMNPETECIEEDWKGWKAGTFREDIWHWFDERHSKGVAYLMYGGGSRNKISRQCGIEGQEEKDAEVFNGVLKRLEGEFSGVNAAEVIRRIMEKEDVKPKELAERMGCMRQNVSQMLNRGTVNMRYDSFYRMADALGYEIILRKK
jgi:hypothetical protein